MRLSGPVPNTSRRSMPRSLANRRTAGDANTTPAPASPDPEPACPRPDDDGTAAAPLLPTTFSCELELKPLAEAGKASAVSGGASGIPASAAAAEEEACGELAGSTRTASLCSSVSGSTCISTSGCPTCTDATFSMIRCCQPVSGLHHTCPECENWLGTPRPRHKGFLDVE